METIKIPKDKYQIPTVYYGTEGTTLVIFLHGVGQTGDGTDKGLLKLSGNNNHGSLVKNCLDRKWSVLAPQFVQAYNDWQPEWAGGKYVDAVVNWAIANLKPSRIFLTGLSGGGGGCWDYVTLKEEYNKKIDAVVPICGTPQSDSPFKRDWSLCARTNLPVRAYHAEDDKTVEVPATINQVDSINKYSPWMAESILYKSGGHNIWDKVYGDPEFYKWLDQFGATEVLEPEPVPEPVPEWKPTHEIEREDGSKEQVIIRTL